jgi:Ca2+-binding RTX toxin-like protein
MRRRACFGLATLVALTAACWANAGTASSVRGGGPTEVALFFDPRFGDFGIVQAQAQKNEITIRGAADLPGRFRLRDSAQVLLANQTAREHCSRLTRRSVECRWSGAMEVAAGGGSDVIRDLYCCANLHGEGGSDRLIGGPGFSDFEGGPGRDRLRGRGGFDILDGGRGADRLAGGRGDDLADGGFGRDILRGGRGPDSLGPSSGDPGSDAFFGGRGRDLVRARDGRADETIDCGRGHPDHLTRDPSDPRATSCERRGLSHRVF